MAVFLFVWLKRKQERFVASKRARNESNDLNIDASGMMSVPTLIETPESLLLELVHQFLLQKRHRVTNRFTTI
jgi:hypothetical protein